jgi:hypothetical protein
MGVGFQKLSKSSYDKKCEDKSVGLNFFASRSSYDSGNTGNTGSIINTSVTARKDPLPVPLPNPDPLNYEILHAVKAGNNLVVEVRYPDCTNYEGRKIMIYLNTTIEALVAQESIDPHFSNNKEKISPFARFEPTKNGWQTACELATTLQ